MKSILGIAETGTGVGSAENSEKVRLYIERKRLLYLTQGEMTWCRNHRVTPEGGLQRVVKIGLGPLRGGDTAAPYTLATLHEYQRKGCQGRSCESGRHLSSQYVGSWIAKAARGHDTLGDAT